MKLTPLSVAVLVLLLSSACATPAGPGGSAQPSQSPPAARTDLEITMNSRPTAQAQHWTLTCQPPAGTHPDAAGACAFVAKSPADVLAPVPKGVACDMLYGGPQVATVKGTWRGQAVDARFSRTNGCEVSRWDRLKPLLGAAGG